MHIKRTRYRVFRQAASHQEKHDMHVRHSLTALEHSPGSPTLSMARRLLVDAE
jgi:hypothetical protein